MTDSEPSRKFFMNPDYADFWATRIREEKYEEVYRNKFLENLKTTTGDLVLEVGVGEGRNATRLLSDGATYVGVDISRTMLNKARDKLRTNHFEKTDLVVGDAQALPFKTDSFDKSMSLASIFFVPDQKQAIRELLSVSRTRVGIEFRNSVNPRIFLYTKLVVVVNLALPVLRVLLQAQTSRRVLSLAIGRKRTERLAKQVIVYGTLQPVFGIRASQIRREIDNQHWKIESLEGFPMMTTAEKNAKADSEKSGYDTFDPVLIAYASAE